MTQVIGSSGAVDLMEVSADNITWHDIGGRAAVESNSWNMRRPNGKFDAVTLIVKMIYPDIEPEAWYIIWKQYEKGNPLHVRWIRNNKKYRTHPVTGGIVLYRPSIMDIAREFTIRTTHIEDWE